MHNYAAKAVESEELDENEAFSESPFDTIESLDVSSSGAADGATDLIVARTDSTTSSRYRSQKKLTRRAKPSPALVSSATPGRYKNSLRVAVSALPLRRPTTALSNNNASDSVGGGNIAASVSVTAQSDSNSHNRDRASSASSRLVSESIGASGTPHIEWPKMEHFSASSSAPSSPFRPGKICIHIHRV